MAFTNQLLGQYSGNGTSGTLYTVPAGTKAILKSIVFQFDPAVISAELNVLVNGIRVIRAGNTGTGVIGVISGSTLGGRGHAGTAAAATNYSPSQVRIAPTDASHQYAYVLDVEGMVLEAGDTITWTSVSALSTVTLHASGVEIA